LIDGKYTTEETAKKVGIHQVTLQRWIKAGKVKGPEPTLVGAVGYRLWSLDEIEEVKVVKRAIYHKGGGRKKKRNK
jgi:DNA-binding transcriptional MerR regulator